MQYIKKYDYIILELQNKIVNKEVYIFNVSIC